MDNAARERDSHDHPGTGAPVQLHLRAMDNLSYIRETMARSASFTAVPGWGMMGMGALALAGAVVAAQDHRFTWWFYVWFFVAVVGCSLGVLCMFYKAERVGAPVLRGSGRKFLMHFSPAIIAGGLMTEALFQIGESRLMPGVWLLMYGVGVVSAGAFSVRVIPLMGLAFMLLGALTLLYTLYLGRVQVGVFYLEDLLLAAGFGGIHIVSGLIVARHHGG